METRQGHTPEEWHGSTGSFPESSGQGLVVSDSDGRNIAIVYDAKRDMALIEAAPELLDAAQGLINHRELHERSEYRDRRCVDCELHENTLRAAIRKATEG